MTRISSALDATIASLDALNAADRERRRAGLEGLGALVHQLDVQWSEDEPLAVDPGRRRRPDDILPAAPGATAGQGFDDPDIPRPKSFHPFGPAVRERLVRELLADDGGGW